MSDGNSLDINDIKRRMNGAISSLKDDFSGLRTGRASSSLLEPISVNAYGAQMPLTQVGNINVPEPRLLTVQVWDASLVSAVEKAINSSNLGLNAVTEGQLIRIPIPELSEERRKELTKVAGQYAEKAKVAARNVRRDGMDRLKKLEKDGHISQDEHKLQSNIVQDLTDTTIKTIDEVLENKEKEIMQV